MPLDKLNMKITSDRYSNDKSDYLEPLPITDSQTLNYNHGNDTGHGNDNGIGIAKADTRNNQSDATSSSPE